MAISPNDTFTSGQILTAQECNNFPFGVVSYTPRTTTSTPITSIAVQITANTFTAIANRNYKITYFEPLLSNSTTADMSLSILLGATQLQGSVTNVNASFSNTGICQIVTTFTAGSVTTLTANLRTPSGGNGTAARGATTPGFLLVEDIGPA